MNCITRILKELEEGFGVELEVGSNLYLKVKGASYLERSTIEAIAGIAIEKSCEKCKEEFKKYGYNTSDEKQLGDLLELELSEI